MATILTMAERPNSSGHSRHTKLNLAALWVLASLSFLSAGCISPARYVITDDESTAFAHATARVEEDLAKEKRGEPCPARDRTWCVYWRLRIGTLERLVANGGDFGKLSQHLIDYIKRRRAEEGLPPCNRAMTLMTKGDRMVPSEVPAWVRERWSQEGPPR